MRAENSEDVGPLAGLGMLVVAPFTMWAMRQQQWQRLDENEKNLRRAGQGVVAVAYSLVGFFYIYGAHGVGGFLTALVTQGKLWPGAVFLGLIVYGLLRFLIGAGRVAGLRDPVQIAHALRKLALGGGFIAWVWLSSWPWEKIGTSLWGALAIGIAGGIALGYAITGTVRFLVLSIGGGDALRAVSRQIRRNKVVMQPARRSRR